MYCHKTLPGWFRTTAYIPDSVTCSLSGNVVSRIWYISRGFSKLFLHKTLLGDNLPWVSHVFAQFRSKILTTLSCRLSFPVSSYSKQPWKIELAPPTPKQRADMRASHYKRLSSLNSGLLSCNANHFNSKYHLAFFELTRGNWRNGP